MTPALAAMVETLEAERLAPVPRASHTVGVDIDDLVLVLEHARNAAGMTGDVALASLRLSSAIQAYAVRGAAA